MAEIDRRTVLALGAATAVPLAVPATAAASERYAQDEGTEVLPGVRQVDLNEREAIIPGYATVSMRDIIVDPGVEVPLLTMENDMVCHMLEGELEVVQDGVEFTVREGDVWTCRTGTEEGGRNTTDRAAIMRITDLMPA